MRWLSFSENFENFKISSNWPIFHILADCFTSLRILKIITVGPKMDSGNAIKNCYVFSKFSDFNP